MHLVTVLLTDEDFEFITDGIKDEILNSNSEFNLYLTGMLRAYIHELKKN